MTFSHVLGKGGGGRSFGLSYIFGGRSSAPSESAYIFLRLMARICAIGIVVYFFGGSECRIFQRFQGGIVYFYFVVFVVFLIDNKNNILYNIDRSRVLRVKVKEE